MEAEYLVHSLGADSQYRCVKFEEKKVKVKKRKLKRKEAGHSTGDSTRDCIAELLNEK